MRLHIEKLFRKTEFSFIFFQYPIGAPHHIVDGLTADAGGFGNFAEAHIFADGEIIYLALFFRKQRPVKIKEQGFSADIIHKITCKGKILYIVYHDFLSLSSKKT